MREQRCPLLPAVHGVERTLTSFHFGEGARKAYLQASLHGDEIPGMLVLHHLRQLIADAENHHLLRGEIVLVPVANPIALGQRLMHDAMGRFDFTTGLNFNRDYPDLATPLMDALEGQLGPSPQDNRRIIHQALAGAIDRLPCDSDIRSLKKAQLRLAHDADLVLDLHCDAQAIVHLYLEAPYWPQLEPLARYLGAEAMLLGTGTGSFSFDEACGQPWWRLADHFGDRFPVPAAYVTATVELRGEQDVDHEIARADAIALYRYLVQQGFIADEIPPAPALKAEPTPFQGALTVKAPVAGVVAFHVAPGDRVDVGQRLADLVDPLTAEVTPVVSASQGVVYMRTSSRYLPPGAELCKIAGKTPLDQGGQVSA
ncbi:succinylglutamate desuccinylase/aspartoacylase family protein [Halomonas cupida]|uniref:succinylglutamate desuccinylase/aspartoacylase family protein n=1 Tax=Halomonas cupida TaxID=44933 RepID=UPI003EF999E7